MGVPNLGRGGLPVYSPTGATLSVANGATAVNCTGTAFLTTDPTTGVPSYAVGVGDSLVVSGVASALVESVTDATHVQLAEPWPGATQSGISAGGTPSWYFIRNSVPAFGAVAKAIQDVLARGSDDVPVRSWTIDDGGARLKLRIDSGQPEFAVGASGTADGSLIPAFSINPTTGALSFGGGGGGSGGGGGARYRYLSTGGSLASGDIAYADTSGAPFTLTLPSSPAAGMGMSIRDAKRTWSTRNLTLDPGTALINTASGNLVCDTSDANFDLVWRGGSVGWQIIFLFVPCHV